MKRVAITKALDILEKEVQNYDVPVVNLVQVQTKDPFKVLLATILSARTKDETTAEVCKRLFAEVDSLESLRKISLEKLTKLVYPVGFYKNKAKYLQALPDALDEKFGGKIPNTVEELVKLPGVGRKTANLVVAVAFQEDAICVDIHVHRIMNRLGYIKTKTPAESEKRLREKLPRRYWQKVNTLLVAFGQNICRPVSPYCSVCPIFEYCNQIGVEKHR